MRRSRVCVTVCTRAWIVVAQESRICAATADTNIEDHQWTEVIIPCHIFARYIAFTEMKIRKVCICKKGVPRGLPFFGPQVVM